MNSRSKRVRREVYSVLIVCEGQNTEPAYLEEFEKYLNTIYSEVYPYGIKFTILPFGPEAIEAINKEEEEQQLFTRHKKKRKFLNFESVIDADIEEDYLAAPTRWVRYAQKQADNAGYDQIWSFFDYDNRPYGEIERAFELANNDEINVKIAFSSYSFEYWLLLHYELTSHYIPGSECKEEKIEINCGAKVTTHPLNCNGKKCIGGYLRVNGYEVGEYNKTKKSTFPALEKQMGIARYHSTYIRAHPSNSEKELWEMKPVTTIDQFVDSLVQRNLEIKWQFDKEILQLPGYKIVWSISNNTLSIDILNENNGTILIPEGNISLLDSTYTEHKLNNKIILHKDEKQILPSIDTLSIPITPEYISIKVGKMIFISRLTQLL